MTLMRLYILFLVSLVLSLGGTLFYDDISAEQLEELVNVAESLQHPVFNHALHESLSDGHITHYEFYNLNVMANRLEIEMKKTHAEIILNKIAGASK